MSKKIFLYDSSVRDGSQAEGISFSLEDKLGIARKLDELGLHYLEGGFPGSNPKDEKFFEKVRKLKLKNLRIAAFGSTHHPSFTPAKDPGLKLLLGSKAGVITVVGKSWSLHVSKVLKVSKERNLDLIAGSIRYLSPKVEEVFYDAEHFFDGYKDNPAYALETLLAARDSGAKCLVLCDTNGGSLPQEISEIVSVVKLKVGGDIGIHCHNDSDMAVANTISAVMAGARQVQGTINGIGERCGNADLCSVIPNLQLKMGYACLSSSQLKKLKDVSHYVYEMANMKQKNHQPYVGDSAFAHKGGLHVDAILKDEKTYEHIEPSVVGNKRRILISDLAGKGSILAKAEEFGIDLDSKNPATRKIVAEIKELEHQGFQFEGAEGSLEILMKKASGKWRKKFDVLRARTIVSISSDQMRPFSEAVIMVKTPDGAVHHAVAEGNGPVNAMDKAIRKALVKNYPELKGVDLLDFKVRILDETSGSKAKTRVLIESGDETGKWGTVGVSENIIEASWQALIDSLDYRLHKKKTRAKGLEDIAVSLEAKGKHSLAKELKEVGGNLPKSKTLPKKQKKEK